MKVWVVGPNQVVLVPVMNRSLPTHFYSRQPESWEAAWSDLTQRTICR
jgi:hypothetical protein